MYRTKGLLFLVSVAVAGLGGCQRDELGAREKIHAIEKRLDSIEQALSKGARPAAAGRGAEGARRPRAERPPGPNPEDVYAVPVEGSPFEGPENAKVTMVEAFEFA